MKTKYSVEELKFNRNMTIIGGILAIVLLIGCSVYYFKNIPELEWVGILMIIVAVIMSLLFILFVSFFNYKIKQLEKE